jgi:hypothetical protein
MSDEATCHHVTLNGGRGCSCGDVDAQLAELRARNTQLVAALAALDSCLAFDDEFLGVLEIRDAEPLREAAVLVREALARARADLRSGTPEEA